MPRREAPDDAELDLNPENQPDPGKPKENHHPHGRQKIFWKKTEATPPQRKTNRKEGDTLHCRFPQTAAGENASQLRPEHSKSHKNQEGDCSTEHVPV